MSIRRNQIRFALLIGLFVALVATALTPTPPPQKEATPTCQITREVKLGEGGIISCTGFTPNGDVKVIFYRPDGSTSEHLGKADGNGNFDGTFTVAPDRPPGPWTLGLTDVPSGRTIAMPFTVIPSLEATPIPATDVITTTITTRIPSLIAPPVIATVAPTPTFTPTPASTPTPTPRPTASPTPVVTGTATDNLPEQSQEDLPDIIESLARSWIAILILLGCPSGIAIGLILLLVKLWRSGYRGDGAPPTPPPEQSDFGDEAPPVPGGPYGPPPPPPESSDFGE